MKVKVNELKKTSIFPMLMKSVATEKVYLMENKKKGVCLVSGIISTDIRWKNLKPFRGEIILSND